MKKVLAIIISVISLNAFNIGFGVGTETGYPVATYSLITGAQWQFSGTAPSLTNYPNFAIRFKYNKFILEPDINFGFGGQDYTTPDSVKVSNLNIGLGVKAGLEFYSTTKGYMYPFFGFKFLYHKFDAKPVGDGATSNSSLIGISLPFGVGLEYFFKEGFSVDLSVKFPLFEMYSEKTTTSSGGTTITLRDVSYKKFLRIDFSMFRLMFIFYL